MKSPTDSQQQELSGLEVELKGLEKEYTQADPVSDQAYEEWIKQFDSKPLWNHLELRDFTSESDVKLEQVQAGHYNVAGELPEKDIWVLTMGVTDSREITSLARYTTQASRRTVARQECCSPRDEGRKVTAGQDTDSASQSTGRFLTTC